MGYGLNGRVSNGRVEASPDYAGVAVGVVEGAFGTFARPATARTSRNSLNSKMLRT